MVKDTLKNRGFLHSIPSLLRIEKRKLKMKGKIFAKIDMVGEPEYTRVQKGNLYYFLLKSFSIN